jgi:hypothetical protein
VSSLAAIPKMCDGRRAPTYYGWNNEDAYPAERERVLAVAAPELMAQHRSLTERLDRASAIAKKSEKQAEARAKERAAGTARKLAPCYLSCDSSRVRCRATCISDLTWGACSACETSHAECRQMCTEQVVPSDNFE